MATHIQLISRLAPTDRKHIFQAIRPITAYKKVYKYPDRKPGDDWLGFWGGDKVEAIAVLEIPVSALIHVNLYEQDEAHTDGLGNPDKKRFVPLLTDKLRVSKARVMRIYTISTGNDLPYAWAHYDKNFIYRVGKMARPRRKFVVSDIDCSSGLHCYRRRVDALEF